MRSLLFIYTFLFLSYNMSLSGQGYSTCEEAESGNLLCTENELDNFTTLYFDNDKYFTFDCELVDRPARSTVFHSFIAGQGDYDIEVYNNCPSPSGEGIRRGMIALFDVNDCIGEIIECEYNSIYNTFILEGQNLIPGNKYLLGLGYYQTFLNITCIAELNILGNYVDYEISPAVYILVDGSYEEPPLLCTSNSNIYTVLDDQENFYLSNNHEYYWSIRDENMGLIDDFLTNGNLDLKTKTNDLEYQFDNLGDFKICVDRVSLIGCYQENNTQKCVDVFIASYDDENFGQVDVCGDHLAAYTGPQYVNDDPTLESDPNQDMVHGWQGQNTLAFGVNDADFTFLNCSYTQTVYIREIYDSEPGIIDTAVCGEDELPVTILGNEYNSEIEIIGLIGDDLAANGCDSIYSVFLYNFEIDGNISIENCNNETYTLQFNEKDISNSLDLPLVFEWSNELGEVIDPGEDSSNIEVDLELEYILTITFSHYFEYTDHTVTCPYVISLDFDKSNYTPTAPNPINWLSTICEHDSAVNYIALSSDNDTLASYNWLFDSTAVLVGTPSDTLVLDYSNHNDASVFVCVNSISTCGISPFYCDTISVIESPNNEFSISSSACVDSAISVQYLGVVDSTIILNWNLFGGIVGGGNLASGEFEVVWEEPGTKNISLSVQKDNCESAINTQTIELTEPLTPPIITCTSTIDEVIFTWVDPPGATGYNPILTSGNGPGTLNGNMFTVGGLLVGETVTIDLFTDTNSPCGGLFSQGSCTTQDCPTFLVTPEVVADICFDASTMPIDLTLMTDNPNMYDLNWSGTAITDAAVGTFDPNLANVGLNNITVTLTDEFDCVYNSSLIINVNPIPTSDFIADNVICQDSFAIVEYTGSIISGGLFDWAFEDVVAPVNGAGPFDVQWMTTGDKTITLSVTQAGCISSESTFPVTVEPRIEPIDHDCDATTSSIIISWNELDNVSTCDLFHEGILIGDNITVNSYTLSDLDPGSVHDFEIICESDNQCPGTSVIFDCLTENCPPFEVTFNIPDTIVCLSSDDFQLSAEIIGLLGTHPIQESWSGFGIDPITGLFSSSNAGISPDNGFDITYQFNEGPCSGTANINIVVIDEPTSLFDIPMAVCTGEDIIIKYLGNTPNYDFNWEIEGEHTLESILDAQFLINWTNPGTYKVSLQVANGDCQSVITTQTVTVEEPIDPLDPNCIGTDSTILFTWTDIDCAEEYYIYLDGVLFETQVENFFLFEDLDPGEIINLDIIPITECVCPLPNGLISCKAADCPPIILNVTSNEENLCQNDVAGAVVLEVNIDGNDNTGIGNWSGPGINANGTFDNSGLPPGTYTYQYTFEQQGCLFFDSVKIEVLESPVLSIETFNPNCHESEVGRIEIDTASIESGYIVEIDSIITQELIIDNIVAGDHNISVTHPNGCKTTYDANIESLMDYAFEIDGASEQVLGQSNSLILNIEIDGIVDSIKWTKGVNNTPIDCDNCEFLNINPIQNNVYCATVFYNRECELQECFNVNVDNATTTTLPNILIDNPSTFVNGRFYVPEYGHIKQVNLMRIYNSSGTLIYTLGTGPTGPSHGWDGTINGKKAVQGPYIYYVEVLLIDGSILKFNGEVLKL